MNYYILEHEINKGDKYVDFESDMNLGLILEGQNSPKTYYQGKNDTDYISGMYGMSEKAKDFFMSLNNPHLEFISTKVYHIDTDESLDLYLMKVNIELDCVDYEESELFMLSDKKIRSIKKLVLKKDIINEEIFNIKNLLYSVTVNESLKNKMTDYGLKGFRFVSVDEYPLY